MKSWFFPFIAMGIAAFAQEAAAQIARVQSSQSAPALTRELAPFAARHNADLMTVETQKKAAVARAQHDYLAALDFADRAASSAGDLKGVVAIGKERDLAKTKPDLALSFPADLPEALRPARKVYLDVIGSANADAQKREQQIDSDYLRTLGMLDSHVAANPALGPQIAAEKAEIIRRATAATPTSVAATTVASGPVTPGKPAPPAAGATVAAPPALVLSEKLVNGKFDEVDANDFPTGWKIAGVLDKGGILPDGVSIKAIKENGLSFLRMTFDGRFHNCGIMQEVAVPNRARTFIIKFRYRGKISGRADNDRRTCPYIDVSCYDDKAQFVGHNGLIGNEWLKTQSSFKSFESKPMPIPNGAVKAQFKIGSAKTNGVFDFEHAEVIFK